MRVSSTEFLKDHRTLMKTALSSPVTITHDDKADLVLLSVDDYQRLQQAHESSVTAGRLEWTIEIGDG